ncbi:MAG: peroxidase-related enzyme [Gemmobacter sp.]
MTAWITIVPYDDADAATRAAMDATRGPFGTLDNVMQVHSLRPNTMVAHKTLYRAALHDDTNTLPLWLQELVGSYVSLLNDCTYSFTNHWANCRHLMDDAERAARIEAALRARTPEAALSGRDLALARYAEKLTLHPGAMAEGDVIALRAAGLDDGQILEANQIVGYFNYANRVLNGLGVSNRGEIIGYYSSATRA